MKHNQRSFVLSKVGPYVSQGSRREKKKLDNEIKEYVRNVSKVVLLPLAQVMVAA